MEKAKDAELAPNYELYNSVAELYKEKKDTVKRIYYLRKFVQSNTSGKYQLKENFALGQAYFQIKDFIHADSVFEVMTQKMPDLHIGYSWRGRSNAAQDPGSKQGLALPHYQKVLDLLGNDAEKIAKYKADFITALRYKAAYLATVTEKFAESRPFWEKILELDPADEDAKKGLEYVKAKGGWSPFR